MRDTTKIKAVAEEALADIDAAEGKFTAEVVDSLKGNLREIANLAKRMDARTGTTDPSTKKPQSGTSTRPTPGRE